LWVAAIHATSYKVTKDPWLTPNLPLKYAPTCTSCGNVICYCSRLITALTAAANENCGREIIMDMNATIKTTSEQTISNVLRSTMAEDVFERALKTVEVDCIPAVVRQHHVELSFPQKVSTF
jgi:hypothetical protein